MLPNPSNRVNQMKRVAILHLAYSIHCAIRGRQPDFASIIIDQISPILAFSSTTRYDAVLAFGNSQFGHRSLLAKQGKSISLNMP